MLGLKPPLNVPPPFLLLQLGKSKSFFIYFFLFKKCAWFILCYSYDANVSTSLAVCKLQKK